MAVEITMPQLSDTMNEGRILTWLKKEGDKISRGDALAEVATDKADLEIESFHEGTLLKIHAPVGETVRVGTVIALIGEAGEVATAPSAPKAVVSPQVVSVQATAVSTQQPAVSSQPSAVSYQPSVTRPSAAAVSNPQPINGAHSDERVKISPLARNVAESYGVDVTRLQGSGEGGRIVRKDVEAAATASRPPAFSSQQPAVSSQPTAESRQPMAVSRAPSTESGAQPLSKMRQTIAERMVQSATTIPHFYVTTKINSGALTKLRQTLKPLPQYEGLTYNHLIIKAVGLALHTVPRINSSYREGSISQPGDINIGIVTAIPDGLLIPVVKNADALPLSEIVSEARALVQRARSGRPKSDDLLGGTFSISNMGMFSVESFTAIINPGQGGILAVSGIDKEPVIEDGKVVAGECFRVTLSVDHRIIDGVVAGEFLTELKRLLEEPVLLLA